MAHPPMIDWPAWIASPPGRYVLSWEQEQLDRLVNDIFGYHAVQLGLPQLDTLRENRMPSRALILDAASSASAPYLPPLTRCDSEQLTSAAASETPPAPPSPDSRSAEEDAHDKGLHLLSHRSTVWCDFLDLPFEAQSIDLLVLPHTLEFTREPHRLLREAERVLMPEGQLIIIGFNPFSLWGARQSLSGIAGRPFVPAAHHLITFARLKDWVKLLGFEFDRGCFGCYRPPLSTDQWLGRYAFMEAAGDRWWPIFGAVYMITVIKRMRGMRLVGRKWTKKPALAPLAPAIAPHSHYSNELILSE